MSFLDSAGFNVLTEAQRHLRRRGAVLVLAGCSEPVQRLLQITGLHRTLPLYASTDAAVADLQSTPAGRDQTRSATGPADRAADHSS